MKKSIIQSLSMFLISILLLFGALGCSSSDTNPISNLSVKVGSLSLEFDRSQIPQSVSKISCLLSREGQQSLSTSLTLSSDSGSVLSFTVVPVGNWFLIVSASTEDGTILYSGFRRISVEENLHLELDMTLLSNSTIRITVSWGTRPDDWIENASNPILRKSASDSLSNGVYAPRVFYENGVYRMWFRLRTSGGGVGYATSTDGIQWAHSGPRSVLGAGSPGAWDGGAVGAGPVVKVGNQYFMYYTGESGSTVQIGLATSPDGIVWMKSPNPVLSPSASWETNNVGAGSVLKVGEVFHLYYHGVDIQGATSICLATSTDGITWTKYDGNPILRSSEPWESNGGIYFPNVLYDNGVYKMVYATRSLFNASSEGFGIATSSDGKSWTKENLMLSFGPQVTSINWASSVGYPSFIKVDDNYKVYYTGVLTSSSSEFDAIGLVLKK